MASTSASSIQNRFKYDVFLSFRGEDTRKNFVDHLYHALRKNSIIAYRDDEEIKKGERITDELIKSIQDSKFYIIVFSKNYASSSWCLDELVKIMECQKTNEHTAYPVFYDVEPTEVRKQSGVVGEAFTKLKEKEAARKWRGALREAADLAGWELKNTFDGHQAKMIQKIVEEISLELCFINSSVDEKLVGMGTRVKGVLSSLEMGTEDVRMIGIWGMGGAGKTTLARAVFDQISFLFDGSSFVENVREISKNPSCGLKSLQKQVLSDVLKDPNITINGVFEGKNIMRRRMCGRKVLVVLDDVDHIDQLEALAGEPNWFKLGSRVIITTREEQVLVAHEVPKNLILGVSLLSDEEANYLFNRYAFGRLIPNQGYEELACQVVRYAAGLPLTIKVLGSDLRGKEEIVWKDVLERLKTIPLKATLEKLELSYESLEEDCKEIFLDVACMLKGWWKKEAIRALESCGLHAINGLNVLVQKSLVTISYEGYLSMHDHIEEMGKNIVRRLQPNKPYRHSRLWIPEEAKDILVEEKGTEATRCIKVRWVDPVIVMNGLRKMKELRFLDVICDHGYPIINYKDINEYSMYLPNSLQYLSWKGYPFTCLPKNFNADNLAGLKMYYSNIDQLWEGGERKVPKKLRFIDLYYCKLRTLDTDLLLNLERLNLKECGNLVHLDMAGDKTKLKHLSLQCSKLKTLNLEGTKYIEWLDLVNCQDLLQLRMPIESPKLRSINIKDSKLASLNLTGAWNLERLGLVQCHDLLELCMPVESLKLEYIYVESYKLRTINLSGARNLESLDLIWGDLVELHMPIESPKLRSIYINDSKLASLNLTGAWNLERLDLVQCHDLLELCMPVESLKLKSIDVDRYKLRTINLSGARNLETMALVQCDNLVELSMPIASPKLKIISIYCSELRTLSLGLSPCLEWFGLHKCSNLVEINAPVGCLSGCVKFTPVWVNQGFPMAGHLAELHLIARSLDVCPLHPENNLPKFHVEFNYKEHLPSPTQNLAELISFGNCACTNLAGLSERVCSLQFLRKLTLEGSIPEVPKEVDQLECLEELTLLSTNIEHLPDSICALKHLTFLRLQSCRLLKQLPEDLGRLECLEELHLTDCPSLHYIPNNICELKRLKCFCITNCILLEKLPKEIGRLKCLKQLHIGGTSREHS